MAPCSAHQNSSHTETSKEYGVFCRMTSRSSNRIGVLHPVQAVDERAVLDHHALRPAGRSRRVDHVRQILRLVEEDRVCRDPRTPRHRRD